MFKNCHSFAGYLFDLRSDVLDIADAPELIINNTTFNGMYIY